MRAREEAASCTLERGSIFQASLGNDAYKQGHPALKTKSDFLARRTSCELFGLPRWYERQGAWNLVQGPVSKYMT